MTKFPAELFVKHERDGDVEYFSADADAACLVEMAQKVKIATYRLLSVQEAEGIAKFAKASRSKIKARK